MKQIKSFFRRIFDEKEINDFVVQNDCEIEKIVIKHLLRCDGNDGVVDGGEFVTNVVYNTGGQKNIKKFVKFFKTQVEVQDKINTFISRHESMVVDDIVIEISQSSRNNAWNIGYVIYQASSPIKESP